MGLMRPAMKLSAPPAMSNNVQLFMRHHMRNSVPPLMERFVQVVMEVDIEAMDMENVQEDIDVKDMVDMTRSARRFLSKAAKVSLSSNHLNSALRCQEKTVSRLK